MHLHEYQAKMILRDYGIAVPDFYVVSSVEEARRLVNELGMNEAVVKVQVHAGGRGKAGGVKIAKSRQEILDHTSKLLRMRIVNEQTGKDGLISQKVLISPLVSMTKEYYLGATIDRHNARAILIASPEGGVEIEEVSAKHPERIKVVPLGPGGTLKGYQLLSLIKLMGWKGAAAEQGKKIIQALARAFVEKDASLIEINPLVMTTEGDLLALDAKMSIDDNALYRQPELASYFDPSQLSPYEVRAKEHDLAYVALDGTIGCMVNGAGLAMATMDIIQHYGGSPANFLDVGGSANEARIAEGFKIILSDAKVQAILVNIFGGIMNCVTLAAGIIAAATEEGVNVPLIVRLEGTNVERGKKLIEDSGLKIQLADTLADAAQKAVAAARA